MKSDRKAVLTMLPPPDLLAWRKANGMDQREAAEYLGISQGYYVKLEKRLSKPRPTIAARVVEKTGVRLEWVLGIAS
jgi:transcriptional regulator with XRE-family HTH domain